jgi:hypothetical protein
MMAMKIKSSINSNAAFVTLVIQSVRIAMTIVSSVMIVNRIVKIVKIICIVMVVKFVRVIMIQTNALLAKDVI